MVEPRDGRVFLTILLLAAVTAADYFGGATTPRMTPSEPREAVPVKARDQALLEAD